MSLKFKQILVAQWQPTDGGPLNYSTLALGEDGRVYRYDAGCDGWVAWSDKLSKSCKVPHKR